MNQSNCIDRISVPKFRDLQHLCSVIPDEFHQQFPGLKADREQDYVESKQAAMILFVTLFADVHVFICRFSIFADTF